MPLALYDDGSGQAIKPAAEIYLSEDSAAHIARSGLMSFLSQRNADSVALLRFQSIADPPSALRGF
jgi:predicted component of type VI protein secretion system